MSEKNLGEDKDKLEALNRLAAIEGDPDLQKLKLEKNEGLDLPLLGISSRTAGRAATGPFVVWLENYAHHSVNMTLYWVSTLTGGVVQTSYNTAFPLQAAAIAVGGSLGCDTVYGYILNVDWNGRTLLNSGVRQPDPSDGDTCADAYRLVPPS